MKHEIRALGRRIDLNLLVIFEAIYRNRNLTAAGRDLGLTQPAMSRALSRLRDVFGDPLFVRLVRGVEPTRRADEVAPAINEGLARIRESFEPGRFDPSTSTRLFTVAMADITEGAHLPLLLAALARAPGVSVRTIDMPPAQRLAALAEGRIDLALANDPPAHPWHHALVGEHGYVTVGRRNHPALRGRLTLEKFRAARHLLVSPGGATRHGAAVERALRGPGIDASIALHVSSFAAVAPILAQSDLLATVPPGFARAMARSSPIRIAQPPVPIPRARIHLCWHERQNRDPGNRWLREIYLREVSPLYRA